MPRNRSNIGCAFPSRIPRIRAFRLGVVGPRARFARRCGLYAQRPMKGDMMLGLLPVQWMLATQRRVLESIMKDDDVAGYVLKNEICENQYEDLSINPLKRSCKTRNHPRRTCQRQTTENAETVSRPYFHTLELGDMCIFSTVQSKKSIYCITSRTTSKL